MRDRDVLAPEVVQNLRRLTLPGEPDVLAEVLNVFLREVPRRMDRLKAALRDGNAAEVQRMAHSLKGSSGNIGAFGMFTICRQIDEGAKAGEPGLAALVDALDEEFRRVEGAIRDLLG